MTRYSPLLVILHWAMAIIILLALVVGGPMVAATPNDDPMKIEMLAGHMFGGLMIGALLIVRLITRIATRKPPAATAGHALLDLGSKLSHWGFYVLIAVVVGSGMAMSAAAGLPAIVFEQSGDPLPASFFEFPARAVHGVATKLLLALIVVHALAALYHQFVLRDGLFRRMWFGGRR